MIIKRYSFLYMIALSLTLLLSANIQSKDDDFVGFWQVTIVDTPLGDMTNIYTFEKKNGQLTGFVQDTTGKLLAKMTDITRNNHTITGTYLYKTYPLKFSLVKVNNDSLKGLILDEWEVTGVRLKHKINPSLTTTQPELDQATPAALQADYQRLLNEYDDFEASHGHSIQTPNTTMHYLAWGKPTIGLSFGCMG